MLYLVNGEKGKGRVACGHRIKKYKNYYLALNLSSTGAYTCCEPCGNSLGLRGKAKRVTASYLQDSLFRKER